MAENLLFISFKNWPRFVLFLIDMIKPQNIGLKLPQTKHKEERIKAINFK